MESQLTLGLIQMAIKTGDMEANRANAAMLIADAARQGAQMVAVPEFFLSAGMTRPKQEFAEIIPGPTTDFFSEVARKHRVHIVLGSICERDAATNLLHNASVLIDDDGKILGKYRKKYLWVTEMPAMTPGDSIGVAQTRWGPIGLTICWDLAFPDLTTAIARAGARLIFNCAHWQANDCYGQQEFDSPVGKRVPNDDHVEERFVDFCSGSRAWENGVFFAFVNAMGPTVTNGVPNRRIGHTQLHAPFHGLMGMCQRENEILIRKIDLSLADTAESVYGLRQGWKRAKQGWD